MSLERKLVATHSGLTQAAAIAGRCNRLASRYWGSAGYCSCYSRIRLRVMMKRSWQKPTGHGCDLWIDLVVLWDVNMFLRLSPGVVTRLSSWVVTSIR